MGSARKLVRRLPRALIWLAASGLAGSSAWAGCQLSQMEIPVRIVDHRPIATLSINGSKVPMLVDSGAFFSMLAPATAEQLNLPLRSLPAGLRIEGHTGRIEAKLTRVAKLGLLDAELPNVEFIVGGNELGAGIMGILGRNILSMADVEYDLAHGAVRLSFPEGDCERNNFAHWAGEAPVVVLPLEGRGHNDTAIRVDATINGSRTQALLDTGAPVTALTIRAARRAGIEDSDMTLFGRVGGAGDGRRNSWLANIGQIDLGGEKISGNRLQIDDVASSSYGILLGLDYFLSHRIYVSRLQNKVYITWNGGPIFGQARAQPDQYDAKYAAIPAEVAKDDADALARRGSAFLAAGNHEPALNDLTRAIELAPESAEYRYLRARVYLATGKLPAARSDLDEALRLDDSHAQARFRRASLRMAMDDMPGMHADLNRLDEDLPKSANLRGDMAMLYASRLQVAEALKQFELWLNSHTRDMRSASLLNSRCWMRTRLNIELPLALQDCKAAVDRDEGSPEYLDSLAWTYLRLNDAAQAKKAFDAAIKLKPRPLSLYGRGLAKAGLRDGSGAELDFEAARKLSPQIEQELRKLGFPLADTAPPQRAPAP
ncbi:putative aspartyl protease/Tfp pilus assembly protein PilF [Paucibacter oligotrophus]|uniref:Putative aspartyl protease/Tfp pilus assembly protein PilF n=1 Tax=Roseateles oligotrophus TaxID=1769250 RepID=A0A840L7W4_9BURK|nr:retroviral-like aspartic protease family protein [Roseateles oligotrophus]MBB4842863.1 putative aspartyl protease/Tfp pilus assembly protein PilF [Roseateles oligotrophus]